MSPTHQTMQPATLAAVRNAQGRYGFLTPIEVAILAADPATRLEGLLVRCGACRFLAGAQDVDRLIGYVEKAGDYVRDVSLPASYVYPPASQTVDARAVIRSAADVVVGRIGNRDQLAQYIARDDDRQSEK